MFTGFLMLACIALSVLVIRQGRAVRGLEEQLRIVSEQVGRGALPVGEYLAPLETFGIGASTVGEGESKAALAWGEERLGTLVYVFNGNCGACEDVRPRVEAIAREYGGVGVRVVGLQLDATRSDSISATGSLGAGVSGTAGEGSLAVRGVAMNRGTWLSRVVLVPSILLVDREGRLAGAWYGAPVERQWEQIGAALDQITRAGG